MVTNRRSECDKCRLVPALWLSVMLCACFCVADPQASAQGKSCEDRIGSMVGKYYPGYSVVGLKGLDADLREYLAENNRRAEPGCIEKDFDGDGVQDYALLLRNETNETERFVVLRGKADGSFIPLTLDVLKDRLGSFYIRSVPPRKITLGRPGVELVLFEAASRVYFWSGGNFHSIQTSE